jgi:hypothetical protein
VLQEIGENRWYNKQQAKGSLRMQIIYHKALSPKKRTAVCNFAQKVNHRVKFKSCKATSGPEGQLVVYCTFQTSKSESTLRKAMARASKQVLDSDNVWVVGVPEKVWRVQRLER